MTQINLTLKNEAETRRFAQKLASLIRKGDVIGFKGDLGAGKSFLIRALIKSLLPELSEVPSPTFTYVQQYQTPEAIVWHYDLYRLEDPEELFELGIEEAVENIALIEWPELYEELDFLIPYLQVELVETDKPGERLMTLTSDKGWINRLKTLGFDN